MTYLKEIKSKNGRALSKRLNHSGSGILAAALFGCFGLLASCTAGDDSLDYGTDAGANIKTASNVSVQQSSSDRITLFKTSGTRAVTRSVATDLTMPDEDDFKNQIQAEVKAGTAYYVPYGETMDDYNIYRNKYNVNLSQITTLYIGGYVKVTNNNSLPNKIVILSTGKLDASVANPYGKDFYCYNTDKDAYTFASVYDILSNTTFSTKGDYKIAGNQQIDGNLYVEGNLTTAEDCNKPHKGHIYVGQDATFEGKFNMSGGSMYVDGKLTAKECELGSGTTWTIGCSATFSEKLYLNGSSMMELSGYGYISSPTTKIDSDGKITINGNESNCFLSLGGLEINNAEAGIIDVTGTKGHATVVTKSLLIGGDIKGGTVTFTDSDGDNTDDKADISIFRCTGSDASMNFYFNSPITGWNQWAGIKEYYSNISNVTFIENSTSVPETPTSCSSNAGNSGDDDPNPTTPTTPTIDDIAVIENIDHKHILSATCVDWNEKNNKVYVSWHARGTGQAGCLEVFDHSDADHPSLVSYMQAWSGTYKEDYTKEDYSEQNDEQQYIDYNHCIYDEAQNRLYAVGNCNAVGGQLSYISLGSDGTFDDSKEYDEYSNTEDITNNGVLKYIALNKGNKKSCDGNCVIRQGDNFLVASTSGFETFDASKLTSTSFVPSEGKGKHIATDGTNVLTLNYNRFVGTGEDKSTPLQAVVKSYAASDAATFSNANTVIDATETIAPNDGKNTIVVDGNYAYVCLSENGLVIYDLNGNKINSFVKDKVTIQGVEVAGGLCNGVAVDDDYIYVAYGSFGLYVFDKAKALDGETMEPVASHKCSKSCNYIKVVDRDSYHYIYIAYGESGLRVCRIAKKNA